MLVFFNLEGDLFWTIFGLEGLNEKVGPFVLFCRFKRADKFGSYRFVVFWGVCGGTMGTKEDGRFGVCLFVFLLLVGWYFVHSMVVFSICGLGLCFCFSCWLAATTRWFC